MWSSDIKKKNIFMQMKTNFKHMLFRPREFDLSKINATNAINFIKILIYSNWMNVSNVVPLLYVSIFNILRKISLNCLHHWCQNKMCKEICGQNKMWKEIYDFYFLYHLTWETADITKNLNYWLRLEYFFIITL